MVIDKPPNDAFSRNRLARCAPAARRLQGFPREAAPSAKDAIERKAMRPSIVEEEGSAIGL
jgi:hypothetical protein